ncbi:hypothetical protein KM043_005965 [Ampulex compressa]|nr:hypothetical protein KM043_005965 [Ampulex compressa]
MARQAAASIEKKLWKATSPWTRPFPGARGSRRWEIKPENSSASFFRPSALSKIELPLCEDDDPLDKNGISGEARLAYRKINSLARDLYLLYQIPKAKHGAEVGPGLNPQTRLRILGNDSNYRERAGNLGRQSPSGSWRASVRTLIVTCRGCERAEAK